MHLIIAFCGCSNHPFILQLPAKAGAELGLAAEGRDSVWVSYGNDGKPIA